jgi:hypothetical protein
MMLEIPYCRFKTHLKVQHDGTTKKQGRQNNLLVRKVRFFHDGLLSIALLGKHFPLDTQGLSKTKVLQSTIVILSWLTKRHLLILNRNPRTCIFVQSFALNCSCKVYHDCGSLSSKISL